MTDSENLGAYGTCCRVLTPAVAAAATNSREASMMESARTGLATETLFPKQCDRTQLETYARLDGAQQLTGNTSAAPV